MVAARTKHALAVLNFVLIWIPMIIEQFVPQVSTPRDAELDSMLLLKAILHAMKIGRSPTVRDDQARNPNASFAKFFLNKRITLPT